jgi:hypothetical protein
MDFSGYTEEPVYNEDGSFAYYQITIKWEEH